MPRTRDTFLTIADLTCRLISVVTVQLKAQRQKIVSLSRALREISRARFAANLNDPDSPKMNALRNGGEEARGSPFDGNMRFLPGRRLSRTDRCQSDGKGKKKKKKRSSAEG